MPSTSSDPPAAAAAPVARSQLRDGDAEERDEMSVITFGYARGQEERYPERTPSGILTWLKAHPYIRSDSPAFPIPNDPEQTFEKTHWIFDDTIAYTVLKTPSSWKTPGLLEEVLRRIPDFDRKDKSGRTLLEALKGKKPGRTQIMNEIERRAAQKEALAALPVLNEVAEKINLSEDVQGKIAEFLTGKTGPVARQEAELRKDIGGRRKRKTARRPTTRNKSRKRGAQR